MSDTYLRFERKFPARYRTGRGNQTNWLRRLPELEFSSAGQNPALGPTHRSGADQFQPVYGQFTGGGLAFGLTESEAFRIPLDAYNWYSDPARQIGDTFTITYRNGDGLNASPSLHNGQQVSVTIAYGAYSGADPNVRVVRSYAGLTQLDRAAFVHDKTYAQIRRQLADGTISGWNAIQNFETADRALMNVARSLEISVAPPNPDLNDQDSPVYDPSEYEAQMNAYSHQLEYGKYISDALPAAMAWRRRAYVIGLGVQTFLRLVNPVTGLLAIEYEIGDSTSLYEASINAKVIEAKLSADGKNIEAKTSDSAVINWDAPLSELAQSFGSTLGRQLAGDNLLLSTLTGSLLGTIGLNVGQQIEAGINGTLTSIKLPDGTLKEIKLEASSVWSDFGNELASFTANAAIGSVSSWLTLELGEKLGLEGFGAEMFSTGAGALLEHTLNNLVANTGVFNFVKPQPDWFDTGGLTDAGTSALASAFVSFFATKLGSLVVAPQTQAAVILSSLGSAAGSLGGRATGGYIGSIASKLALNVFGKNIGFALSKAFSLIPGIGIFIGFILGAFIGNLFGRKKPKIPTANAEVSLQIPQAEYALTGIYTANGGNRDLVKAMGEAARDTLNGLIQVVARGDDEALVSNATTIVTSYGHAGGQLWVRLGGTAPTAPGMGGSGGTQTNVSSADEAVDKGVLWALPQTQIIGGQQRVQ